MEKIIKTSKIIVTVLKVFFWVNLLTAAIDLTLYLSQILDLLIVSGQFVRLSLDLLDPAALFLRRGLPVFVKHFVILFDHAPELALSPRLSFQEIVLLVPCLLN